MLDEFRSGVSLSAVRCEFNVSAPVSVCYLFVRLLACLLVIVPLNRSVEQNVVSRGWQEPRPDFPADRWFGIHQLSIYRGFTKGRNREQQESTVPACLKRSRNQGHLSGSSFKKKGRLGPSLQVTDSLIKIASALTFQS